MPKDQSTAKCLTEMKDCTGLVVVKTKIEYIEDAIKNSADKLENIDGKVDSICNHIAKQNGALPTLQSNMSNIITRIDQNDKDTQQAAIKAKIAWAVLSSLLTGGTFMIIKMLLGG